MNCIILGAGLSSLSLAYFLQDNKKADKIIILEKEDKTGGLCRTFTKEGIEYDVGPHIIFSKDEEILDFMNGILGDNIEKHRRSNKIIHKRALVQYPFENDLSKLDDFDKEYCVNSFINNPYENYEAQNMLQFFLKTFGEGITNLYLRPYNEKIWKFDPVFMDTQMVDRIPKPPKEDILKSAKGHTVDGYLHQLYFTYPKHGGTEALIKAISSKLNNKIEIHTNAEVLSIEKKSDKFFINTSKGEFSGDKIISSIPLNLLSKIYKHTPKEILEASKQLKYNSIAICILNVKKDYAKDNYAFMCADKNVIFHRVSKLDFMGGNYTKENSTTYMAEITYRKNDLNDLASDDELISKVVRGLKTIGFIDKDNDVNFSDIRRFEYAYVIYDLNHRKNTDIIKNYFDKEGIYPNGRFGTFEYLNMDKIIRQSKTLAKSLSLN